MANEFLVFGTTGGANVTSQAAYQADANRGLGQQPGIASSAFNNKALRQGAFIASQLAQMVSDKTGTDVADDGITAHFLSQLKAAVQALPPKVTKYASSTGTHGLAYYFFIATGSATVGATYTNNAVTFTVVATVASGTLIQMTGIGAPAVSGTLTKSAGTGDATLTFYAYRAPLSLRVQMVGAGGQGGVGANGTSGTTGADGGDTTFGTTFLTAGGGKGGTSASNAVAARGGVSTIVGGLIGLIPPGQDGGCPGYTLAVTTAAIPGGTGGSSFLGGGAGGGMANNGLAAIANSGGGGGGNSSANAQSVSGGGGGGGGGIDITIPQASMLAFYGYSIGVGGTGSGAGGGNGGSGVILLTENYQ